MSYALMLKKNWPRLISEGASLATVGFAIKSILSDETKLNHSDYNIATMLAPIAAIFNISGRLVDHWSRPEKRRNIMTGCAAILLSFCQMFFSGFSVFASFKQPIALSSLTSAASLFFGAGVNWEPAALWQNKGRIFSLCTTSTAIAFAIPALILDNTSLFFASNLAFDLSSASESFNRVQDIVSTHGDETNALNKGSAILAFLVMLSGAIASTLGALQVCEIPIAMPMMLAYAGLSLYLLAQCDFAQEDHDPEQALLFGRVIPMMDASLRLEAI